MSKNQFSPMCSNQKALHRHFQQHFTSANGELSKNLVISSQIFLRIVAFSALAFGKEDKTWYEVQLTLNGVFKENTKVGNYSQVDQC